MAKQSPGWALGHRGSSVWGVRLSESWSHGSSWLRDLCPRAAPPERTRLQCQSQIPIPGPNARTPPQPHPQPPTPHTPQPQGRIWISVFRGPPQPPHPPTAACPSVQIETWIPLMQRDPQTGTWVPSAREPELLVVLHARNCGRGWKPSEPCVEFGLLKGADFPPRPVPASGPGDPPSPASNSADGVCVAPSHPSCSPRRPRV